MGRHPVHGICCNAHHIRALCVDCACSQDSFYKPLNQAQHTAAHRNEYDFDSPDAIDYDLLVERLKDLKAG